MTLKFEQTAEDYIDFNFYYNWSRPEKLKTRLYNSFFPLAAFILFKIAVYKSLDFYPDIFWIAPLLLIVIIMTPIQKWNNKIRINNLIKSGKNTDLIGQRKVTFEDNKVLLQSDNSNSEINWSAFEKLCETKNHLFLFATVNQAILIPKRIFSSDKEIDEVRYLINQKLGQQRH